MHLTPSQVVNCKRIVSILETGRPEPQYGRVTIIPGDSGHLTYGAYQASLMSGNLYLLLRDYCKAGGTLTSEIAPLLPSFEDRDTALDDAKHVHELLREAGKDETMHHVQDQFYDRLFFLPACEEAQRFRLIKGLSTCVVFDSHVHGSWWRCKAMTDKEYGPPGMLGEPSWIYSYVQTRAKWLAGHKNPVLRKTVYRMETFLDLINNGNWGLEEPMWIRGWTLPTGPDKVRDPIHQGDARSGYEEIIRLRAPYMKSKAIKEVQRMLGMSESEQDGVYGPDTRGRVMLFQDAHRLKVDGIVGPATWSKLRMNGF